MCIYDIKITFCDKRNPLIIKVKSNIDPSTMGIKTHLEASPTYTYTNINDFEEKVIGVCNVEILKKY